MADWYKLVERYSICALTFDRDRLPVIAGIARFVASYDFACEYLFGLWSKSLHHGLPLVAADNSLQEVFYGLDYDGPPRSPSWPWARWKGRILFPRHIAGSTPLFQLVDNFASLTLLDSSPAQDPRFLTIRAEAMDLQGVMAPRSRGLPGNSVSILQCMASTSSMGIK
jgi:hypothetical protein